MYMPQDGHWLATFEVTPPENSCFFRAKRNYIFKGCAPTFEKNLRQRHTQKHISLFWLFSILTISTLANNKQQAVLLKWIFFLGRICVFCFSGENVGTILSRRSRLSRTSRAPSRLIGPRSIDCDREPEQTVKTGFWPFSFSHI